MSKAILVDTTRCIKIQELKGKEVVADTKTSVIEGLFSPGRNVEQLGTGN